MPRYPKGGVTLHSELTDVSTPHVLADLESAVCSETEALELVLATIWRATLADWELNPATGTFVTPERLNDGETGQVASAAALDDYCEVNFGKVVVISRFRHFGRGENTNTNGRFKLEYKDADGVYHDWVSGIIPVIGTSWSEFDSSGGEVACQGIKLTCTTFDAASYRFG
ncbi:unnamed protein product, partial [marine sediment metagenome]